MKCRICQGYISFQPKAPGADPSWVHLQRMDGFGEHEAEPTIEHIEALDLHPGDILVIKGARHPYSPEHHARLKAAIEGKVGFEIAIWVLMEGESLDVVRPQGTAVQA